MSVFAIAFITLLIVMTITTKSHVESSVSRELSTAVTSALRNATYGKHHTVNNNEELMADIVASILEKTGSSADVEVDFKTVDIENGIVAVSVTQEYTKLNGKKDIVTCDKCVVLEESDPLAGLYTITYITDNFNYKIYKVKAEKDIPIPKDPKISGKTFKYWTYNGQQVDIRALPLTQNYTFVGVFE